MILTGLFILAVAIQCGYALYFFWRIFSLPGDDSINDSTQPVSIIICAKNEAANLQQNLPVILSQKYGGAYEVIVVNDGSTDDTAEVLKELEQRYDNLWDVNLEFRVWNLEFGLRGKKAALQMGMQYASHDWLLLTDADCMPASDRWLELMVAPLGQGKEIVAGYGGYNKAPGLLNAFVRWETVHTFFQYSTYILAGKPYMAVGRNMACTKAVLQRAQQDELWNALPSGDDDLLVRIAGNADNTAVVCDKKAFTYTNAKTTWEEWVKQKQRHLSTGKYYKPGIKFLLSGYAVSHALLWLVFFVSLFALNGKLLLPVVIGMAIRCIVYWCVWGVTAYRLREKRLIYLFPFFDIEWMVYNFAFLPYITFKNKNLWK